VRLAFPCLLTWLAFGFASSSFATFRHQDLVPFEVAFAASSVQLDSSTLAAVARRVPARRIFLTADAGLSRDLSEREAVVLDVAGYADAQACRGNRSGAVQR
jgi:hypothetical protein